MSVVCAEPAYAWPECVPDPLTAAEAAAMLDPAIIAAALQQAALDVLSALAGCDYADGQLSWGSPIIEANCCGQIRTGIITPAVMPEGCVRLREVTWHVAVTWCQGAQSVTTMSDAAGLLSARLTDQACCLLADAENPETVPKLRIVGEDNSNVAECPQVVFTVKAT